MCNTSQSNNWETGTVVMSSLLKIEMIAESAARISSSVGIQAGREVRLQKAKGLAVWKETDL